jgi:hypothetical protein
MIPSKSIIASRTYNTLRDAENTVILQDKNVEVDVFLNYYGTVESHKFNDPILFTKDSWWKRFKNEIKAMRLFKESKHD